MRPAQVERWPDSDSTPPEPPEPDEHHLCRDNEQLWGAGVGGR